MSEYETFEEKTVRERVERAEARADEAERRRDAAIAELEKVKRDVGWMMEHGLIRDVIFQSDPAPAGEAPYAMDPDPEDIERLRWLNEHGRVTLGDGSFTVSFPHGHGAGIANEPLPTPYNIRHLLDVCRFPEGRKSE